MIWHSRWHFLRQGWKPEGGRTALAGLQRSRQPGPQGYAIEARLFQGGKTVCHQRKCLELLIFIDLLFSNRRAAMATQTRKSR
ncbi:hypothetical protein RPC_3569 [Rhodopseudomonas palustris BisB18]|uniref:Uncharacterized protein n=1 Tax=Rhodopseudomonas palustris (strain BisB18) TaxID=316056 RepID=Q210S8_RHOPB